MHCTHVKPLALCFSPIECAGTQASNYHHVRAVSQELGATWVQCIRDAEVLQNLFRRAIGGYHSPSYLDSYSKHVVIAMARYLDRIFTATVFRSPWGLHSTSDVL